MYKYIISVLLSVVLAACSGGGGGSGANNGTGGTPITAPIISGTVATGSAFVGNVNVYGSAGANIQNVAIDADGIYSVNVGSLQSPYLLCAVPDNTALATLCSWASGPGITNITQMTSLALYYANAEQDPVSLINTWQTDHQAVSARLPDMQAMVNANFVGVFDVIDPALDIDFTTYDFLTSSFVIGDTYDQILALLDVDLSSSPPIILINGAPFAFDAGIDISGIDIGGTPGGGTIGLGSLAITGIDTAVTGTTFMPLLSGVSSVQDNVAVAWQNPDASGMLSVQSEAGQIAYLIYAYGDIVQGAAAIPVDSYINLLNCVGVTTGDCGNISLDTTAKKLTLNNVQLTVPLQVGVPNQATAPIVMNGSLSWK